MLGRETAPGIRKRAIPKKQFSDPGDRGVTLPEFLLAIAILMILAAVGLATLPDLSRDAADVSAKNILASMMTGSQLEFTRRLAANQSLDFTFGDILANVEARFEHVNYAEQGNRLHVRINGYNYWYIMSRAGGALPSISIADRLTEAW